MTDMSDIGWAKYRNFEGPLYKGVCKFDMPSTSSVGEDYKRLAVITATEGGKFDNVNMYDRCIVSLGLVQWCEASMFGTSNMLGAVANLYPKAITPVLDRCAETGYEFKQLAGGKWRFHAVKGEVIDTVPEQQRLFLLNSDGTQGSWDNESKDHAKKWACALSDVFQDPVAQKLQVQYTVEKLMGFVMPSAKPVMFTPVPGGDEKWMLAAQAAFLSFSANLPAVAAKHLNIFMSSGCEAVKFSPTWVVGLLKELTFGPEIMIYPARYNAIRPVLEKLYGIDLPDFADELKKWHEKESIDPNVPSTVNLDTTFGLQHALINLGYDIGPKGADGVYGNKTKQAVMEFQSRYNLQVDGIFGPRTRAVMFAVLHSMR